MADAGTTRPPRAFPDDFPELKGRRDGRMLAIHITAAADTLTSVDLTGVCPAMHVLLLLHGCRCGPT